MLKVGPRQALSEAILTAGGGEGAALVKTSCKQTLKGIFVFCSFSEKQTFSLDFFWLTKRSIDIGLS